MGRYRSKIRIWIFLVIATDLFVLKNIDQAVRISKNNNCEVLNQIFHSSIKRKKNKIKDISFKL